MIMKKTLLLWLFGLCAATLSAQENIFVLKDSYVYPNSRYIDSQVVSDMSAAQPSTVVAIRPETTLKGSNTRYSVKLSKYDGDYPGDFHIIEVLQDGKRLCGVTNPQGWTSIPDNIPSDSEYFFSSNLSTLSKALFFFTAPVGSNPPYLTIIVIKTGRAHLVYHRPCVLRSVSKNTYSVKLAFDDSYPAALIAVEIPAEPEPVAEPVAEPEPMQPAEPQPAAKKKSKKKSKKADEQPLVLLEPAEAVEVAVPEPVVAEPVVETPAPEQALPKSYLIWSDYSAGLLKIEEQ